MSDMPATIIETPNPYEELLALPTIAQQLARLQHANLARLDGCATLLDDVRIMRTNRTQALQLATLCANWPPDQSGPMELFPSNLP